MTVEAKLRFMIVDDDPDGALITCHVLRRHCPDCHLATFTSPTAAIEFAAKNETSLLVSDCTMLEMSGLQMVRTMRQRGLSFPIILSSARCGLEKEAIAAGANVFVDALDSEALAAAVKSLLGSP